MKKSIFISIIIILIFTQTVLVSPIITVQAFDYYIVDQAGEFLSANTKAYPDLLTTYTDDYGFTIRRMTSDTNHTYPNYSALTSTIENSDGTLMTVNRRNTRTAWDIFSVADGQKKCDLAAFGVNGESDYDVFRWSNTNPNIGYLFTSSNLPSNAKLWKITIDTNTWQVSGEILKEILPSELPSCPIGENLRGIWNKDEGPPSWDGRYWGLKMACTNDTTSDNAYAGLLLDRDMYGSELPGIKGWTTFENNYSVGAGETYRRVIYSIGVTPGGGYFFWREYYGVYFIPVVLMNNATPYTICVNLFNKGKGGQAHFDVQYDDLGNEVYVAMRQAGGGGIDGHRSFAYWRFNNAPSDGVTFVPWWFWETTQYASFGNATHQIPAGVIEGPRSWVAILPTNGGSTTNECGYENIGATTITFAHLSTTKQKVFRIAHARHENMNYVEELKGGASRDGTKFYFQSNWCTGWISPSPRYNQIFRAELPANWWNEVLNITPDTTPPSPPIGVAVN